MAISDTFAKVRSGLLQVSFLTGNSIRNVGSAFLVKDGIVTNRHVLFAPGAHQSICFRFDDSDPNDVNSYLLVPTKDVLQMVSAESSEHSKDFAFLKISDPRFAGRHVFEFAEDNEMPRVGDQIGFLGFPFGTVHLTAHLGYVSSRHVEADVEKIQIDGSVNGGNSGGPAINLETSSVVGIVTRAHSGFVAAQFDNLLASFDQNIKVLEQTSKIGGIDMLGINVFDAFAATQRGMREVAANLRRSANVGIGFAFSSKYVRDAIRQLG